MSNNLKSLVVLTAHVHDAVEVTLNKTLNTTLPPMTATRGECVLVNGCLIKKCKNANAGRKVPITVDIVPVFD